MEVAACDAQSPQPVSANVLDATCSHSVYQDRDLSMMCPLANNESLMTSMYKLIPSGYAGTQQLLELCIDRPPIQVGKMSFKKGLKAHGETWRPRDGKRVFLTQQNEVHEINTVAESLGLREDVRPNISNLVSKLHGLLRYFVGCTGHVGHARHVSIQNRGLFIRNIEMFGGSQDEKVFRWCPAQQLHLHMIATACPPPADLNIRQLTVCSWNSGPVRGSVDAVELFRAGASHVLLIQEEHESETKQTTKTDHGQKTRQRGPKYDMGAQSQRQLQEWPVGRGIANVEPQPEIDETCTQQQLVLARLGFRRVGFAGGCSVHVRDHRVEVRWRVWKRGLRWLWHPCTVTVA